MAARSDPSNQVFREVFRNRSATEFALVPSLATIVRLILGVAFAVLLLLSVAACALGLLHVAFGFDPISLKEAFAEIPQGMKGIAALLAGLLFALLFFGTMAYWCFRDVGRRILARRYVMSGKPLRFVEGPPTFEEGSESGFIGLEIGEFYFGLDDCSLSAGDDELAKLRTAGGTLRVWYVPTGLRTWNNPATGKIVRYGGILVRAEWRP